MVRVSSPSALSTKARTKSAGCTSRSRSTAPTCRDKVKISLRRKIVVNNEQSMVSMGCAFPVLLEASTTAGCHKARRLSILCYHDKFTRTEHGCGQPHTLPKSPCTKRPGSWRAVALTNDGAWNGGLPPSSGPGSAVLRPRTTDRKSVPGFTQEYRCLQPGVAGMERASGGVGQMRCTTWGVTGNHRATSPLRGSRGLRGTSIMA